MLCMFLLRLYALITTIVLMDPRGSLDISGESRQKIVSHTFFLSISLHLEKHVKVLQHFGA